MPLITIMTHSSNAASDWNRRSEKMTHMMMPAINVRAVKLMAMPVVDMARLTASRRVAQSGHFFPYPVHHVDGIIDADADTHGNHRDGIDVDIERIKAHISVGECGCENHRQTASSARHAMRCRTA